MLSFQVAKARFKQSLRRVRYRLPWWLRWSRVCPQCGSSGCDSCVGKIPWRREWQRAPVFLPGIPHGQRIPAGCSPWGRKESDTTEWPAHRRAGPRIWRGWGTCGMPVLENGGEGKQGHWELLRGHRRNTGLEQSSNGLTPQSHPGPGYSTGHWPSARSTSRHPRQSSGVCTVSERSRYFWWQSSMRTLRKV